MIYTTKNENIGIDGKNYKVAIIVSEWHLDVGERLLNGAVETLKKYNVKDENITIIKVPGSVEITPAAKWLAETNKYDAIICLGCVIQGETKHFDYVCQSVTHGITELNLRYNIPFVFGVLTTYNKQQAFERAGGKFGNKGSECAETALIMISLKKRILNS